MLVGSREVVVETREVRSVLLVGENMAAVQSTQYNEPGYGYFTSENGHTNGIKVDFR